jgi:hypothetical protein
MSVFCASLWQRLVRALWRRLADGFLDETATAPLGVADWDVVDPTSSFANAIAFVNPRRGDEHGDPVSEDLRRLAGRRDEWLNATLTRLFDEADHWKARAEAAAANLRTMEPHLIAWSAHLESVEEAMWQQQIELAAMLEQVRAAFGPHSQASLTLEHIPCATAEGTTLLAAAAA